MDLFFGELASDGREDVFAPCYGVAGGGGRPAGVFRVAAITSSSPSCRGQGVHSPLILRVSGDAAGHPNESESPSALRRTMAPLEVVV